MSLKLMPNRLVGLVAVLAVLCCGIIGCGQEPVGVILKYQTDPNAVGAVGTADMNGLLMTINERMGRAGRTKALSNGQIEVDVYGEPNAAELKAIKLRISTMGFLEFRILADSRIPNDRSTVEEAKLATPNQKDVVIGGNRVAEWITYSEAEFGAVDEHEGDMVKRRAGDVPEVLVLTDPLNVTGEYLTAATKALDERGKPAIHVSFDRVGATRFHRLTSQNKPNPATPDVIRRLGIILDKRLLSAPEIREAISDRAMISGGSISEYDVDSIIAIFHAGVLPYPIRLMEENRVAR